MNPRIGEIAPSLIRSINARKLPGDIDLGLGEPTLKPDIHAFESALEWTRSNGSPYSPNAGFSDLREAVADYVAAEVITGGSAGDAVCITVGSEEAIFLAIKTVIDPSVDEVLIVEPCYLAYPKICALEGIRHRMVRLSPEDNFAPNAELVLAAVRPETRLLIINTPANPTSRVWPERELRRLAEGLERKPGRPIFILSDEVYREVHFADESPISINRLFSNTLVAGSLSKSNSLTGLRLGWLVGPTDVIREAIKVHQFVNTCASTFSQRVGLYLLSDPSRIRSHHSTYSSNRHALIQAAQAADVRIISPEGSFYTMVQLPERWRDRSVSAAEEILQTMRVVTVPGLAFGESAEGWLRLSWVAQPDVVAEGIRRIAEWVRFQD